MKYLAAHFGLALAALLVGFYICKRFPNLFQNVPVLNGTIPGMVGQ